MKYCPHCGGQMEDNSVFCPKCGEATDGTQGNTTSSVDQRTTDTIRLIAKIFMIITCVATAIAIIPLIWTIPMTISYSNKIKRNEPADIAFAICTLFFVNTISGILMIIDYVQQDQAKNN